MLVSSLRLLALLAPTILSAAVVSSPIADEAVAAVMKLRSRPSYSWEISTLKPGDPSLSAPPRTIRGAVTSAGEMFTEQIWSDGLVLETVSRRDGKTVVRTPDGWFTGSELEQLSARPKKGQSKWLGFAVEALDSTTPEETLTRLLNDSISWERRSDFIEMALSQRGASYWIGSGRLVPNATGRVELRLSNGLVRECRLIVEGDGSPDTGGAPSRISLETILTLNYYGSLPAMADEAARKLDEAPRS